MFFKGNRQHHNVCCLSLGILVPLMLLKGTRQGQQPTPYCLLPVAWHPWCQSVCCVCSLGFKLHIPRVGQNRTYTPYMAVYLAIFLPKIPYIYRIYICFWPTLHMPRGHSFLQQTPLPHTFTHISRVVQNHTFIGIYGADVRFWPTLHKTPYIHTYLRAVYIYGVSSRQVTVRTVKYGVCK